MEDYKVVILSGLCSQLQRMRSRNAVMGISGGDNRRGRKDVGRKKGLFDGIGGCVRAGK